jgi:hypothetical protein
LLLDSIHFVDKNLLVNSIPPGQAEKNGKEATMQRIIAVLGAVMVYASTAVAGAPSSYQVTGPVLEVKDDMIVVQKGKEKWQIARDKDTKVTGDLKVGAKATIQYQMKATSIDVKGKGK